MDLRQGLVRLKEVDLTLLFRATQFPCSLRALLQASVGLLQIYELCRRVLASQLAGAL